jgi:hypothetical protein
MVGLALVAVLICSNASAQDAAVSAADVSGGDKTMAVGAFVNMGMANMIGDIDDAKMRFAGGFGAYFDFYITPMLAIEAGLGVEGKGERFDSDDWEGRDKITYLEIPLGVKLNISNFQASLLFVLNLAMAGKTKSEGDVEGLDISAEVKWNDDMWDHYRRFNIGPKIVLGYAIPVGPISIVPGISWSLHLLNEWKGLDDDDFDENDDDSIRAMNIMFRVGVEFSL